MEQYPDDGRRGRYGGGWRRNRSRSSSLVMGTAVVAVGLILLLDNLGIVPAHELWDYWPLILIALGVTRILDSHSQAALIWGGLVAGIGALFLLRNLHIFYFNFEFFWPLIVIAVGASMLLRGLEGRHRLYDAAPGAAPAPGGMAPNSDPSANAWAVFGGTERRIDSQDFRSADVAAVFGGVKLDLRRAKIQAERAVVDINTIFGGVELFVPDNWTVTVEGTGIFGAFEDKTFPPRALAEGEKPQKLVVTGFAIFGGATVKN